MTPSGFVRLETRAFIFYLSQYADDHWSGVCLRLTFESLG